MLNNDYQISKYIDRFDRLFFKINGIIIIYGKHRNEFVKYEQIELTKNDLENGYELFKVFENYMYFKKGNSLVIMNFENKKEIINLKIEGI